MVAVSIHTNRFRTQDQQYAGWLVLPLVHPSSDSATITHAALSALGHIYRPGFAYKKAGVVLMEIGPAGREQRDLFAQLPDPRRAAAMATMDRINREFGRGTLRLGSEDLQRGWAMRQEKRSPRWTTSWEELPTVY